MISLALPPEFAERVREAFVDALLGNADLVRERLAAQDPENTWLTPEEARAWTRLPRSTFARWVKTKRPVVSYTFGSSLPRYQLASLQALARAGAINLPLTVVGQGNKPRKEAA